MPERSNKMNEILKSLQTERTEKILLTRSNHKNKELTRKCERRLTKIERQMIKKNQLSNDEKNIHMIWIGILPAGEFDNLKLWAKYHDDHKIHIWTDSYHILAHCLDTIIFDNISKNSKPTLYDYQLIAQLKDEFYHNYQLKNQTKTFDDNAKQFLIDKQFSKQTEIATWISDSKLRWKTEIAAIKKYTTNDVILHDVVNENNIFYSQQYYEQYLQDLEYLHNAVAASDRLHYTILYKLGGTYLDTDVMLAFDLNDIKNNKKITELVALLAWDENNDYGKLNKKIDVVINQLILLQNLEQLDADNLQQFANDWEKIFKGDANSNFKILQQIASEFKKMKLTLPQMTLTNFPINNGWETVFLWKNW